MRLFLFQRAFLMWSLFNINFLIEYIFQTLSILLPRILFFFGINVIFDLSSRSWKAEKSVGSQLKKSPWNFGSLKILSSSFSYNTKLLKLKLSFPGIGFVPTWTSLFGLIDSKVLWVVSSGEKSLILMIGV